jgi:hypothetical protein
MFSIGFTNEPMEYPYDDTSIPAGRVARTINPDANLGRVPYYAGFACRAFDFSFLKLPSA